MVRVLEQSRKKIRLSLHKMFVMAPDQVMDALASFVTGKTSLPAPVKSYIHDNLEAHREFRAPKLHTLGSYYDLQSLYDEVNERYFRGAFKLSITWYGKELKSRGSSLTFGLYDASLRLIKIHRILDQDWICENFIRFVIYHEMLHHVFPPYVGTNGQLCVHNQEFKLAEKAFPKYQQVKAWEKANRQRFFGRRRLRSSRKCYGRT